MKLLEKVTSRGKTYVRLMESYEVTDAKGATVRRRRTVLNVGSLADLDDGKPGFLERLRRSFKEGNPILPALEPHVDRKKKRTAVWFESGDPSCRLVDLKMAPALLDRLFGQLGLAKLLAKVQEESRARYDLTGMTRLLVYGRLLDPRSRISTMDQNSLYYRPPVPEGFQKRAVYDVLDDLCQHDGEIQRAVHEAIMAGRGRDTSVVLYDLTSFWWEIDDADEDPEDADPGSAVLEDADPAGAASEDGSAREAGRAAGGRAGRASASQSRR